MVSIQRLSSTNVIFKFPFTHDKYELLTPARERNDAVSKLNVEMKNLEKLERERREMVTKFDQLNQEQQNKKTSLDLSKNVGDLNMKLKMEIGALRGENEGLQKKNDEIRKEISDLEDQIQVWNVKLTNRSCYF